MKKKNYIVSASETVFYDIKIKAKNKKEARELVMIGNVQVDEPVDAQGFQIDSIELA